MKLQNQLLKMFSMTCVLIFCLLILNTNKARAETIYYNSGCTRSCLQSVIGTFQFEKSSYKPGDNVKPYLYISSFSYIGVESRSAFTPNTGIIIDIAKKNIITTTTSGPNAFRAYAETISAPVPDVFYGSRTRSRYNANYQTNNQFIIPIMYGEFQIPTNATPSISNYTLFTNFVYDNGGGLMLGGSFFIDRNLEVIISNTSPKIFIK